MNWLVRTTIYGLAAALVLALGITISPRDATAQGWEPKKPVEFVIMAGKGGGADRLSRLIQGIIEKNGFASKPFVPVNKGGGSGAEALIYLKDHKGDPHVIMATLNSYYLTPLRQPDLGIDISKYTPITRMAEDTFQLWVNADSDIMTVDAPLFFRSTRCRFQCRRAACVCIFSRARHLSAFCWTSSSSSASCPRRRPRSRTGRPRRASMTMRSKRSTRSAGEVSRPAQSHSLWAT